MWLNISNDHCLICFGSFVERATEGQASNDGREEFAGWAGSPSQQVRPILTKPSYIPRSTIKYNEWLVQNRDRIGRGEDRKQVVESFISKSWFTCAIQMN
jgi:hypothetical protein